MHGAWLLSWDLNTACFSSLPSPDPGPQFCLSFSPEKESQEARGTGTQNLSL